MPLIQRAPSLQSLSGKTLDVQGRKIVQLDCGNGHSLSVQFYVCTAIAFAQVSVAGLLLQDFWTAIAKDYLVLIDPRHTGVFDVDCHSFHRGKCGETGSELSARSNVGNGARASRLGVACCVGRA